MQVLGSALKGRFEWSHDLDCEYNPQPIGWRAWYVWARIRLRKPREGRPQYDFLSAGVYMNSCATHPKVFRRELFTGIRVGLFERYFHIGRWRHVDKYNFSNQPAQWANQ